MTSPISFMGLFVASEALRNLLGRHGQLLKAGFFLLCAIAYTWWGFGLIGKPERFVRKAIAPYNRLPRWAVRAFGVMLLVGSVAFMYGLAKVLQ